MRYSVMILKQSLDYHIRLIDPKIVRFLKYHIYTIPCKTCREDIEFTGLQLRKELIKRRANPFALTYHFKHKGH